MRHHREVDPTIRTFARSMRKVMTEAERRLWSQLRNRALDGFKFRRQVPIGSFIADFVAGEARLIVEIDGSQHLTDGGVEADAKRTAWLKGQGYRVLRFTNLDVLTNIDGVYTAIQIALHEPKRQP